MSVKVSCLQCFGFKAKVLFSSPPKISFLDAFVNLRKATITRSFVTRVRLSAWNNSAPIGRIFMIFEYFSKKTVQKIQASLKSDKHKWYLYLKTTRHF
jgi:hypothetical protein